MNRWLIRRYKKNKRELGIVGERLSRLQEQLDGVQIVSGKVTKSSDDFPYIEEHISVEMEEPKEASAIKDKMRTYRFRQEKLLKDIREVEDFIRGLPEGIDKQILEIVYLDGFSQAEAAEMVGYTQSMISKIIKKYVKDS